MSVVTICFVLQLMQSLFMESPPEDFEEEWLFIVCPPGKRRVLVAANVSTIYVKFFQNLLSKHTNCSTFKLIRFVVF